MQELVAGVLRAMGYKTRVSPAGPDRGRDIIASPDGFGFQPPRIVVEVKPNRTNQNLTFMDADDLGKAIVEHYDRMDSEARALLPLKKIYWPV
jgi:restriction system protein